MATPLNNASLTGAESVSSKFYVQIAAALLFGSIVLFAVGFLATDVAHNAAHDTRHSFAFPCY